jgi:uncharacterized protein involved in outer membrane biogenesis
MTDTTSSPTPPPHEATARQRRPGRWVLGISLVLLGTVAACEVAGWPFLARPVERGLSNTLQREFLLRSADDQASSRGATVHFLGGLTVDVPMLQIGAPAWSRHPYFVHAEGANLKVSYAALWRARRGEPLDIERLRARKLVVHAERMEDQRASWQFGDPAKASDPTGDPVQLPTVQELTVNDGELTYKDAPLRTDIQAQIRLEEGTLADNTFSGLVGSAKGTYGNVGVTAKLTAAGAMPLLAPARNAPPTPVELDMTAGRGAIHFKGTVSDVLNLTGLAGSYKVSGPSLAVVGDPLGVTLPTTGPFSIAGRIAKQGQVWNFVADKATVGSSQLSAALTYDMRPKVPLLSGRVTGPRLLLADLAPAIGGEPAASAQPEPPAKRGERVLPDREFDLPSLRAMNANVLMAFDRMELGSLFALPLQPLKAHLTLQDGRLAVSDLEARTADGSLGGDISLDGTGKIALWKTDLRWSDVRLERWLKQERGGTLPPYISGRLQGRAMLTGEGRSTAQILGSLDGSVRTHLKDGKISHLAIEAAGLDIAQALGVFIKGDSQLPVQCALADLQASDGVLKPRALVVDTGDSNLWVTGNLSLEKETLDLRAVVSPKDFSPLTLRTPVHVKGTFGSPDVSLEKAPLGRKLAASALLALINPVAAIIPLIDLGKEDPQAKGCPELVERVRQSSWAAPEAPAKSGPHPVAAETRKAGKGEAGARATRRHPDG